MSEEILEKGVLTGNPINGWRREVKKTQVRDTEDNKIIIQKGHGLPDISCRHGSRWIWNVLCIPDPCWMQVVHAPGCNCGDPPKPYKIQVSRIRKPYFDAIVSGDKKEELKALSPYWIKRLLDPKSPPNIMKFICGKRVHSRKITSIHKGVSEFFLGRPMSDQAHEDLEIVKNCGWCIIIELGKEVKA